MIPTLRPTRVTHTLVGAINSIPFNYASDEQVTTTDQKNIDSLTTAVQTQDYKSSSGVILNNYNINTYLPPLTDIHSYHK